MASLIIDLQLYLFINNLNTYFDIFCIYDSSLSESLESSSSEMTQYEKYPKKHRKNHNNRSRKYRDEPNVNCDDSRKNCDNDLEKGHEDLLRIRNCDESDVIRKMRELRPNELLLNEKEDVINTSVKPDYKRTSKYNIASLSNTKGSDYDVTGLSNIKKDFSCDDNLSNKYSHRSYFKTGEIIDNESYYGANEITNDVVSLDSDTSDEETNKHEKHHHPKIPNYIYTLDMDKNLLIALRTHKFLRDYIDRAFNEISRSTRQRNRIHDNEYYIIGDALFRAPY
ncbi:8360_t:CDS:2 [Funneliformis caledonium]|uniref:8360_t:CDS:1 n=1 Tax=Funneliformis caledonium TaxID=1117310 RepID=A0A9N9DSC0_9GLOM|nr:8360_t:CDS:2 [Funneliformis caledonium]